MGTASRSKPMEGATLRRSHIGSGRADRKAHVRALRIVPLEALREHAIDVPEDPGSLR